MNDRAPRGGAVRPAPAKDKATPVRPPAQPPRRGRPAPARAGGPRRAPRFEVDRIVVLRVALVAILLAFLYLVVWIGVRAFGSGKGQAARIDRQIIDATAPSPLPPRPANLPGADAAPARGAPP